MKCKEYAELFLVLSDENRIRIIQLLANEEMCACEILEEQNITQPTLSHHMKKLVKSNLVIQRREKKNIYYSLNMTTVNKINEFVNNIGTSQLPCKEDN